MWWIVGGLLIWFAVAAPFALLIGMSIREGMREQEQGRERRQQQMELVP
jgi:hypothetical protein